MSRKPSKSVRTTVGLACKKCGATFYFKSQLDGHVCP